MTLGWGSGQAAGGARREGRSLPPSPGSVATSRFAILTASP